MTEREHEATDADDTAFEGPAAPPAKGGGQDIEDLDVEFEADDSSLGAGGLEDDEGASPPPSGGGGR
jgi:hypothetical protein